MVRRFLRNPIILSLLAGLAATVSFQWLADLWKPPAAVVIFSVIGAVALGYIDGRVIQDRAHLHEGTQDMTSQTGVRGAVGIGFVFGFVGGGVTLLVHITTDQLLLVEWAEAEILGLLLATWVAIGVGALFIGHARRTALPIIAFVSTGMATALATVLTRFTDGWVILTLESIIAEVVILFLACVMAFRSELVREWNKLFKSA